MRTNELGNIHVPSRDQALSLWSGNIDSKTQDATGGNSFSEASTVGSGALPAVFKATDPQS